MEWDPLVAPPEDVCPEKFCFFWTPAGGKADLSRRIYGSLEEALNSAEWASFPSGGCACSFGVCRRTDKEKGGRDWYEPCEPELIKAGLPIDHFVRRG